MVIQSEFYVKPDPQKRTMNGAPLHVLDGERLRAAQPTHTVFNGVHNGMVDHPLAAQARERVRGRPPLRERVAGGAIGLVSTASQPAETDIEHHNIRSVKVTPTDPEAARGGSRSRASVSPATASARGRSSVPTSPG
jgi:hypothetical protein